ncbi:MAG: glycosyltransferase family 39 protein [Pseudomonadota bacterium]
MMKKTNRPDDWNLQRCCLLFLLLCLIPLQAITSIRLKSASVEEGVHLYAGTYHLLTGRQNTPPGYPWLIRAYAALPLWISNVKLPEKEPPPDDMYPFELGSRFLYQVNDADSILFKGRLMIVGLSIFLGLYVFRFAKDISGWTSGYIALLFYVFCPNILAHSRLVTTDLALTAFVFIAIYYYYRALCHRCITDLIGASFFTFLSINSKYTGLLLFPIFILSSLLFRYFNGKPNDDPSRHGFRFSFLRITPVTLFLLVCCTSVVLTNAIYLFNGSFSSIRGYHNSLQNRPQAVESTIFRQLAETPILSSLPVCLPAAYLRGLDLTLHQDRESLHPNWYLGKLHPKGGNLPGYYLTAFALKTPLPLLIVFILPGLLTLYPMIVSIKKSHQNKKLKPEQISANTVERFTPLDSLARYQLIYFLIPCAVFFLFFSLICQSQLGLRLILPIYPFLYVTAGFLIPRMFPNRKPVAPIIAVLTGWFILSSLLIHPHYLSYFNELAGGPEKGIHYFADSNIDWGEDIKGLKAYMDMKGIPEINLMYYGPNGSPETRYYGIRQAPTERIDRSPWAISATWQYYADIDAIRNAIPFSLKTRQPEDTIGHSIYIYLP